MNKNLASIFIAIMLIVLFTVGLALIGYVVDWLHLIDFLMPNSDELNISKFGSYIRFWLLGFLTALIVVVAYLIFGLALNYADQILKRPGHWSDLKASFNANQNCKLKNYILCTKD